MKVLFVSSIAPITPNPESSRALYVETLGLPLEGDGYLSSEKVGGVKHFGLWPLADAAQACFGRDTWPDDLPVPQASIEFEVEDVAAAEAELEAKGYRPLVPTKTEGWGQTVARLLTPEGLLIGVTHTPWMHEGPRPGAEGSGSRV
jgi:catechol 2,3-dioxygenase-like lactoylglutathione lyase family enzyme